MTARLQLSGLRLAYGKHDILRGIDRELQPGELTGLIGPNGSGKSSLMRACTGLVESVGDLRIEGFDPRREPLPARRAFGYAVEPERLPGTLRGRQCIELIARTRQLGADAVARAIELAHTLGLAPWLERETGDYSLGTRQKLSVVLALIGEPPLLLLDEVLNGLDPLSAFALKQELRRRADAGATVLLATHGLETAERYLDRAVLLLDGRIEADWNRQALAQLREQGGGLEAAVVARLQASPSPSGRR